MTIRRSNRGSASPLAYIGVAPESTPAWFEVDRAPTTRDYNGYFLGDFWLDIKTNDVWILISLEKNVSGAREATWVKFVSGDPILRMFTADIGNAIPAGGALNVLGFQGIETVGSGGTITAQLDSSALNGQVFIGGGIAPTLGYITSTGGTLTITNASNSITITSPPGGDLETVGSDSGIATPVGGTVTVSGATNINTTAAGAIVTINLDNDVTLATGLTLSGLGDGVMQVNGVGLVTATKGTDGQILIDATAGAPVWANITSSGATVSVNNVASNIELEIAATGTLQRLGADTGAGAVTLTGTVNVLGGDNINTSGAGSTTTVNLDNSITLAGGLILSASGAGVLQNSGAGVISSSNGTDGQLLIGSTAGVPSWANITSTTLTVTNGPGTINIEKDASASPCPPFLYVNETDCGSADLGGAGFHYFGDDVVLTKVFDDGNNVYPGDGAGAHAYFEAPVTGKYLINMAVSLSTSVTVGTLSPDIWLELETTPRSYFFGLNAVVPNKSLFYAKKISALCDLTALDKVYFKVSANTAVATTADGTAASVPVTWFSGFLIEN